MIATSSLELDQVWSTSSLELPPLQGVAARPPTVGELVEAMDEELIVIHLVNASGAPPARTRALLVLSTALSSERGGAPVRQLALQMRSDVTSTKPIEPDFFQGWGAVPGFNGVGEWPQGVDASFFGRAECDLSFGGAKMPLQLAGGSAQLVTYTLWAATTASPPRDAPGEEELVRRAQVSDTFAALFNKQRLEAFKLEQAESAARFALRHNGQLPRDRLQGPTRALEAIIMALAVERDRLERENNV